MEDGKEEKPLPTTSYENPYEWDIRLAVEQEREMRKRMWKKGE